MKKSHANPLKPNKSISKIILAVVSFIIIFSIALFVSTTKSKKSSSVSYLGSGSHAFGKSSSRMFIVESEDENVYYLGEYVVNLTHNSKLLFQLSVKCEEDSFEMMQGSSILVQNAILEVFASTGSLRSPRTTKGKKALKEKLVKQINSYVGTGVVEEIYFKKYIIQ